MPNPSPESAAPFWSILTFSWFTPIASLGSQKNLDFQDLWDLQEHDSSKFNSENCEKYFKKSKNTVKSLWETYKKPILLAFLLRFICDALLLFKPFCLKLLLGTSSEIQALSIVMYFLMSQMHTFIDSQHWALICRLTMRVRTVLIGAVYKKSLKLSSAARKEYDSGAIMSLLNNEAERLEYFLLVITDCSSAIVQLIFATIFLFYLFGWVIFPGIFLAVLMYYIKKCIDARRRKHRESWTDIFEERRKLETEALNGIRMLKLYSWERNMEKKLLEVRENELEVQWGYQLCVAYGSIVSYVFPILIPVTTFLLFITSDHEKNILTSDLIFVSFTYFNMLERVSMLSSYYSYYTESYTLNEKMNKFFEAEEVLALDGYSTTGTTSGTITIENGQFTWNNDNDPILRDISLHVKPGQLVAIVGKVGAGKSSLIQAILGEMNRLSGDVQVNGTISYVPQQAWIQNMTLQDNILFDKPFNSENYDDVIRRCALEEDLSSLPKGDQTEIGEKGINLSGGQKQRISLARSVYQNTDIVLLDDPLSAVDARVGKHIFENVVCEFHG